MSRIRRGVEQLSSSSGWRVVARNAAAITVAGAGVKGLFKSKIRLVSYVLHANVA